VTRPKVLITSWLCDPADPILDRLRALGCDLSDRRRPQRYGEDEMIALVQDVDAVIAGSDQFTARVIAAAPRLKIIARVGVGYDTIDLAAATARGIAVTITPGANDRAVADYTFGLIIAVARFIPASDRFVRAGEWRRLAGADVAGATLGIIGLGRIGKNVARRAQGFEMRVLAYDTVQDPEFARQYGVRYVPLETLLAESDFVTIHTPLTPETRHLLNAERLRLMKPTAYLINTARGEIVDEAALAQALREGWIAGAALDVFAQEPPWDSPLMALRDRDNVVFSPHIAGSSRGANAAMYRLAVEEVARVLSGQPARYAVNPEIYRTGATPV